MSANIQMLISSFPGQNGRHFTDNYFRCILVNEKFCILIKILLKFVPKCLIKIEQIAPLSFQATMPHKPRQVR